MLWAALPIFLPFCAQKATPSGPTVQLAGAKDGREELEGKKKGEKANEKRGLKC
jgi:hypothetical protein